MFRIRTPKSRTLIKCSAALVFAVAPCFRVLSWADAMGKDRSLGRVDVGGRTFPAQGTTATGEVVVHMWSAPLFQEGMPHGGFPVASNARHSVVWHPSSREEGAFNHHAALGWHDGQFFAMWSNHSLGEDASGQRVLFAVSSDGREWSAPQELFPAPDTVRPRVEKGLSLRPDRWWEVGGRWFAVAYLAVSGMRDFGWHPVARELRPDGKLGPVFFLRDVPANTGSLTTADPNDPRIAGMTEALLARYLTTGTVSWWAQREGLLPAHGVDGASLIEPFTYKAADRTDILLMRFFGGPYNNRLYVSAKKGSDWAMPRPTDIPDSPSRSEALALPSGAVLLIGNQIAPYYDRRVYLDRDPLTISISVDGLMFDRVFILRAGAPREWRFPGIGARNIGFAYSSSLVRGGTLYVLYSVGKEDMEITEIPLADLGL